MASYYIFYRADDPEGEILSVAFIEQEAADEAVTVDPSLAYVVSATDIDKTAYYITVGPPRALSLKPPMIPPVMQRLFYKLIDANGVITLAVTMTVNEADLQIAADTTLGYVTSSTEIDPSLYWVNAGVLTARSVFGVTFDKYSITSDGTDTATLTSTLPNPTTITLMGDEYAITGKLVEYGIATATQTYTTGAFTLKSRVKGPHRLRFEKARYVTQEVTINVV
jgi:hypothetical protein